MLSGRFHTTHTPSPAGGGSRNAIPINVVDMFARTPKRKRGLLQQEEDENSDGGEEEDPKRSMARAGVVGGLSRDVGANMAASDLAPSMAGGSGALAYGTKRLSDSGLGNSKYENTSMTLANFATNTSVHMGTTINMLVANADSFYTTSILPFRETDELNFEQSVITFDTRLLENVPEFGSGRIQGSTRHTTSWSLDRKAAGIHVSADMLRSAAGQEYVGLQVKQIWNCVVETNNFNVIYALITSQNCARRRIYELNRSPDIRQQETLIRESIWLWDIAKARHGLEKLDTHASNIVTAYGGRADVWIVPSEVADHMALDNPARTTASVNGVIQTERYLTDGGNAFKVWPRGKVYIPRHFLVSERLPVNPLQFTSMIGEHYIIQSPKHPTYADERMARIQIYDEPKDSWATFSLSDVAANDPFIRESQGADPTGIRVGTGGAATYFDVNRLESNSAKDAANPTVWNHAMPSTITPSAHFSCRQAIVDKGATPAGGKFAGDITCQGRVCFGALVATEEFLTSACATLVNTRMPTMGDPAVTGMRTLVWKLATKPVNIGGGGAAATGYDNAKDVLYDQATAFFFVATDTVFTTARHTTLNGLVAACGAGGGGNHGDWAVALVAAFLAVGTNPAGLEDYEINFVRKACVAKGFTREQTLAMLRLACTDMTRGTIKELQDRGCPLPIGGLILRPHMRYSSLACIKLLEGGETGHSWYRPGDFSWGQDAAHKELRGSYAFHCKAVVEKPENVFLDRTAFINGYAGGGAAEFFPTAGGANDATHYSPDYGVYTDPDSDVVSDPSMFAIIVPSWWSNARSGSPHRLHLTREQEIPPQDDLYAISAKGKSVPDHALYDSFWNWTTKETNMSYMRSQQQYNDMTKPNYMTFCGHTRHPDPNNGAFGSEAFTDTGKGHWGASGTFIGCNRIRRGDISKDRVDRA